MRTSDFACCRFLETTRTNTDFSIDFFVPRQFHFRLQSSGCKHRNSSLLTTDPVYPVSIDYWPLMMALMPGVWCRFLDTTTTKSDFWIHFFLFLSSFTLAFVHNFVSMERLVRSFVPPTLHDFIRVFLSHYRYCVIAKSKRNNASRARFETTELGRGNWIVA